VEECAWIVSPATNKPGPVKLAEHQKEFLREATRRGPDGRFVHRTAVACWPRREGKSLCVALLLGWRLHCFTQQRLLILANSERQAASNVFELLASILTHSPRLQELGAVLLADRIQVPQLDNVAEVAANNWRTVQGRPRTDALASDELHAAQSTKAFDFASNQLEAVDAQCLISSQAGPPTKGNPLWRLYEAREEPHVYFSYMQAHVMPWAQALADRERATLLPAEWSYQHENCWGQVGLRLFAAAAVEAACQPYEQPRTRGDWQRLLLEWQWRGGYAVGVGLDRAGVSRKGDRSVWTVVARHRPPGADSMFAVVLVETLPTGSEAEVLAAWQKTERIVGRPGDIIFETYGCSDLVVKVPRARLETPTAQAQQGLFNRLYRLFEEARIRFPKEAGVDGYSGLLKEELIAFSYDAEGQGLTRFGTQTGAHDDHVYSLAWGVEAAAAAPTTGGFSDRPTIAAATARYRSILD